MKLFEATGVNYIGVADISSATAWYIQKLGLRKVNAELDDCPECISLGFEKDECALCLGPLDKPTDELTPMFYSPNLKKAKELLVSRGVNVSEIQRDRQGNDYFEMRDLEGHTIEINSAG
jgi:hypothetical protein